MSRRKRDGRPLCRRCSHEKSWHMDPALHEPVPCMYGHVTPSMDHAHAGCSCPGFNARRNVPDVVAGDELRIEQLVRKTQAALDELCVEMKRIVREKKSDRGVTELPLPREDDLLPNRAGQQERRVRDAHKRGRESAILEPPIVPKQMVVKADADDTSFKLTKLGQQILNVLAHESVFSREELAVYCVQAHKGGYFANTLGILRTEGLIAGLLITDKGRKLAKSNNPSRGDVLRAAWYVKVKGLGRDIIEMLRKERLGVSKETIATAVGRDPLGGYMSNTLGKLRSWALIYGYGNTIRINEVLR